jgi:hypothetical protein
MLRTTLIAIIAISLIGFILFKAAASYLCEPQQANSVATVISSVVASDEPVNKSKKPDPLSWEPLFHRLINTLSKACPK